MGFQTAPRHTDSRQQAQRQQRAADLLRKNAARAAQLQQAMPSNRELLDKVKAFGFQKL